MIEKSLWHPVASQADLAAAGDRPLPVTLFGEDYVLWRDAAGAVQCFPDRCPHRGARLSMGALKTVDDGRRLVCGYHGWAFGSGGRCQHIPAAPSLTPVAAQSVRTHAVQEAHGLVWMRPADGTAALPDPGAVPSRAVVCGPFDVATSSPRAVENFLDTAHFAYVHEGWLGDLAHPDVPPYEVATQPDGRPGVPTYLAWQPRASSTSTEGCWIEYRYQVLSPYSAILVKQAAAASDGRAATLQEAYALWTAPVDEEHCRVWFTMYTSDPAVPDADLVAFETTIFTQDQPILESQRPRRLPVSGGEAHGPADRLSTAYRRYLREAGIAYGVC